MADMWHYTSEGKPMDPVSGSELKQLAASGMLKPTDLVWKEGMAKWVKASSAKGLFSEDAMMATAPMTLPTPSKKVAFRSDDEDEGETDARRDRPRREKRLDPDERSRDDDDEPPRRKRRRQEGMSTGAKVAILGGSAALLIGLVVTAIVLLSGGGGGGANNPGQAAPGIGNVVATYTVSLADGGVDARSFPCRAGMQYQFIAISDKRGGDVDLFVLNNNEDEQAFDDSIGPDSNVHWNAPYTGNMRVEISNLGPGGNRTVVTIREAGLPAAAPPPNDQNVPNVPNVPNNPPPEFKGPNFKGPNVKGPSKKGPFNPGKQAAANPPPAFMGPVTVGAGFTHSAVIQQTDPRDGLRLCKVYSVNMTAGKTYTLLLESGEIDSFLKVQDSNYNQLALDDDGAGNLNSQIIFIPQNTGVYRVIASDLGGRTGGYTLKIFER